MAEPNKWRTASELEAQLKLLSKTTDQVSDESYSVASYEIDIGLNRDGDEQCRVEFLEDCDGCTLFEFAITLKPGKAHGLVEFLRTLRAMEDGHG